MTRRVGVGFALMALAAATTAFAQEVPAPSTPPASNRFLAANYELVLSVEQGAEKVTYALVAGSEDFSADFGDVKLFGRLVPAGTAAVVDFRLEHSEMVPAEGGGKARRSLSWRGAVRIEPGEAVSIVRTPGKTIRLAARRLGPATAGGLP